ncbi:GntR family transcriptional regulator [Rhodobacteraceae bacterium D3-12]|nr:GntR family transcriptional regulator [Rhodobacteraceae bacterium D3-12]
MTIAPPTPASFNTWQSVQDEVLRRIHTRMWKPGELIPNEADIAAEFGCARTTVNRALRALAESGILERKRKSGTRVALHPVGRAVFEIPVIRKEIADQGRRYDYTLMSAAQEAAPSRVAYALKLSVADASALHVQAVHLADGLPYVLEDRWINLVAAPDAAKADFAAQSANEWLLEHAPFSGGEIAISAAGCGDKEAALLDLPIGAPVLTMERTTWGPVHAVTTVRLWYRPEHRLVSPLVS